MDFKEIKQLINSKGEKVILVEDGKPTIVLMSFDDYREMAQAPKKKIEKPEIQKEEEKRELTLEDLPF